MEIFVQVRCMYSLLNLITYLLIQELFTPLYMAAQIGNQEIVMLLLAHGADPSVRTKVSCHYLSSDDKTSVATEVVCTGKKNWLNVSAESFDPDLNRQRRDEPTPSFYLSIRLTFSLTKFVVCIFYRMVRRRMTSRCSKVTRSCQNSCPSTNDACVKDLRETLIKGRRRNRWKSHRQRPQLVRKKKKNVV